jgi:predicted thioredoxin/glutaredoxin
VQWHDNRFIGIFLGSKVNYSLNRSAFILLLLEYLMHKGKIKNVTFFNMNASPLVRLQNLKKSVNDILLAIGIIINDDNLSFASVQNLHNGVAANISQATW